MGEETNAYDPAGSQFDDDVTAEVIEAEGEQYLLVIPDRSGGPIRSEGTSHGTRRRAGQTVDFHV